MSIKEVQIRNTMMQNCMDLIGTQRIAKIHKHEHQGMTCPSNQVEAFYFLHTKPKKPKRRATRNQKEKEGRNKLHNKSEIHFIQESVQVFFETTKSKETRTKKYFL